MVVRGRDLERRRPKKSKQRDTTLDEETAIYSHHQQGRSSRYGGGFGRKYDKLL
jgi:hypothetical protein